MQDCRTLPNATCRQKYKARCVIYHGPNLPCIDTYTYDNLQEILININEAVCNGGSVYTASNIGSGVGVFSSLVGNDFQFKSLVAGSGIGISDNGNEIIISTTDTGEYWSTLGNEGTNNTNFLGTTDEQNLIFKTNSNIAGLIENSDPLPPYYMRGTGGASVYFGSHAGENSYTSVENQVNSTFIGTYAGRFARSGANTFVGFHTGYLHTFGGEFGGRNVAVGNWAMNAGYRAYNNTAIGTFAFNQLWDGHDGVAVGKDAAKSLVHGDGVIALGGSSLLYSSTGISGATITNGGSGYTTASVTISAPNFGPNGGQCSITATGTAIIDAGVITGIVITEPGCGYFNQSDSLVELGVNISWDVATITITGDGTGATATPIFASPEGLLGVGGYAGIQDRFGQYNSYIGVNAGYAGNHRYYDSYNMIIGNGASVDISIPSATPITNATAIGKNARVASSNAMVLGGTGVDAVNVGIGTIAPTYPLEVVGAAGALIDGINIDGKALFTGAINADNYVNIVGSMGIGYRAAQFSTGVLCTAVGAYSQGLNATTSSNNTSLGAFTLSKIGITGNYGNTAIGSRALYEIPTYSNNTAIGAFSMTSLKSNGVGATIVRNNTCLGASSMSGSTTGGEGSTFIGYSAGSATIGGSFNTSLGAYSMGAGGLSSIAGGVSALVGIHNIAIGVSSMFSPTTASRNTAVGGVAGQVITTGSDNSFLGYGSGSLVTTGNYNVIIGSNNGSTIATTNNNIIISDGQGNTQLNFISTGAAQLNSYGIGTFTGTAAYTLQVDSSGNIIEGSVGGTGTVTSVDMSIPTGFAISGNPITTSGTLALAFDTGYSLPSNATQATWTAKQDALVSGTNIKTINSTSLLGSGDISISGCSFGTDNQIPYTNSGGTDFDYSANFTFDGTNLDVIGGATFSDEVRINRTDLGNYKLQVGGNIAGEEFNLFTSAGSSIGRLTNNSGYMALVSSSLIGIYPSGALWLAGSYIQLGSKTYAGTPLGTSPTAWFHIRAGSATANTAPLKLTSGTNLTTEENGAMEYDGTHLYFTIGSTRYQLDQQSSGMTFSQAYAISTLNL